MVIYLERGADLRMAQLMPLPLPVSCFSKIQIGFSFLVPTYPGSPGKRAVKRVCVMFRLHLGGSVAEWLACWTQAQKGPGSYRSQWEFTLSSNSLWQTAHTHCASVCQAAKLVAALLRIVRVTAGVAESNVNLPPGL